MQALSDRLGAGLESQLGKVFAASVGAGNADNSMQEFTEALGVDPEEAYGAAQGAIDGLINQTLNNIGMERTEALEARWWSIPSHERASIASRLLYRDGSVLKELRERLR